MGLTVQFSQRAATVIERMPLIDRRFMRKMLHHLSNDPQLLVRHPFSRALRDSSGGENVYVFPIGEWVLELVLDAGDLVVGDVRRFE